MKLNRMQRLAEAAEAYRAAEECAEAANAAEEAAQLAYDEAKRANWEAHSAAHDARAVLLAESRGAPVALDAS